MAFAWLENPTTEPISVSEAKEFLRIALGQNDDNALIAEIISEARDATERYFGQAFAERQALLSLDYFPPGFYNFLPSYIDSPQQSVIELPFPPLVSVDSIQYLAGGTYLTLSPSLYVVDTASTIGRVYPAPNTYFPVTDFAPSAVKITFTTGASNFDALPIARTCMRNLIHAFYVNRGIYNDSQIDAMFERLTGMGDVLFVV